jgi:hypothetical protein
MANAVRVLAGVLGALMVVAGIVALGIGQWAGGLWAIVAGAIVVVAVVLERSRYQSAAAERSADAPGPGGGEHSRPVAPFRATGELFVDPTSGARLRVYVNPATGERRYYAEDDAPPARP